MSCWAPSVNDTFAATAAAAAATTDDNDDDIWLPMDDMPVRAFPLLIRRLLMRCVVVNKLVSAA